MGGSAEATCPRGGESRQRLIGAGTELFAARGFTATSVRDIIAAAGWPNWAAVGYHLGSDAVDLLSITDNDDPRVLAVLGVDEEDAPIAQLAVMLAPAVLLRNDHHLLDAGLGVAAWVDAPGLVQQVAAVDGMVNGSARLTVARGSERPGPRSGRPARSSCSPVLIGPALAIVSMLVPTGARACASWSQLPAPQPSAPRASHPQL